VGPATTMRSGQSVGTARGAIAADSRTSAALGRAAPAPSPALKYTTHARVRKRERPQPELPTNANGCGPRALTGWGVREKASADSRNESRILTAARIIRARQCTASVAAVLPVREFVRLTVSRVRPAAA
jgi:hypothetical protein